MLRTTKRITKAMLALAAALWLPLSAQAGEGHTHVHFAAFMAEPGHAYPATVNGDNIEADMLKEGAEMMLFAHSAAIQNGDVLNLQNDTLREAADGGFTDIGLNCQINVTTTGDWSVAGICEVFFTGDKVKNIVKPVTVKKELVWYKVFEDKAQGVAGYFMKETGKTMD